MKTSFLLLWTLLVASGEISGQQGQTELSSVVFEGSTAFPEDSLSRTVINRPTRCRTFLLAPFCALGLSFSVDKQFLNERELSSDMFRLQSYFSRRGYREAQIDTVITRSPDEPARLVFRISEGEPLRVASIEVRGASDIEGMEGLESFPLEEGEVLSSISLSSARDTLIERLENRGYPRADVITLSRRAKSDFYSTDVIFDVRPGSYAVFGPISLTGNSELSDSSIRKLLPFREGMEYSTAKTLEGQRNLFAIEMIQHVTIEEVVDPGSNTPDSVVPLQVRISEGEVHRMRAGFGWSTADCLNTESRWVSRNFMGGARRMQVRARLSNIMSETLYDPVCGQSGVGDFGGLNWLVSADFSQPRIFRGFSFGSSLFFEKQSLQDVFVRKAVGLDLSLARLLNSDNSLTFSYRPQLTELEAAEIFFCTSFRVCRPDDISGLQDPNWLAPLGASLVRDRTNSLLNPSKGYQVLLDLEHASSITGSSFEYNRISTELGAYEELGGQQVLAARIRAGWVGSGNFNLSAGGVDVIHPQKRFYAGGANSVRGFAQNQLGSRVLTIDSPELLLSDPTTGVPPCTPEEIMALQCDANSLIDILFGTPRPTGGHMVIEGGLEYRVMLATRFQGAVFADFGRVWNTSELTDSGGLELTPGLGFRYLSPIGPIRIDVGYRFRDSSSLQVVTPQIRPFDPNKDQYDDKIRGLVNDNERIFNFVRMDDLALLDPKVTFGKTEGFSLSRFQLHLSIGQAF